MRQPNSYAYQRALSKLARMHRDEFADLLVAERSAMGLQPEAPKSRCGTRHMYGKGCRCRLCHAAFMKYEQELRDRGIDNGDPRHGKVSGYSAGCRCDQCRAANANRQRQRRAKQRAQQAG